MRRPPRIIVGLAIFGAALSFLCIGLTILVEIPLILLFGWIYFLLKTLPSVQPDWSAIGLALITLAFLITGIHRAGRRWANDPAKTAGVGFDSVGASEPSPVAWKLRWTASLVIALLLIFTAGISVVGVVHQAVWMMTSQERMIDSSRWRYGGSAVSKNHLRSIDIGLHNYADIHGSLPSGGTFGADGRPLHSAMTMILPFIEQQALFETIDLQQPWNEYSNRDVFETVVPIYQFPPGVPNPALAANPSETHGFALSNYAGNMHVLRLGRSMQISEISDGTSNTILFGEVKEGLRPWGDPLNVRDPAIGINQGPKSFGSPFSGGCNMLLADGAVLFVSQTAAPDVLKALSTPASGEPAGEF
ncbi:MAG: DUF1559 domain-containing protein [Planctomycetota bacterium]|nr:MAG: DUF1559 domain-containing protein [Planctomycetota bacterium]